MLFKVKMNIQDQIEQMDWRDISGRLNASGYALINKVLTGAECDTLVQQYDNEQLYRKIINMERYGFGSGQYKYFNYPLPGIIQQMRQSVYPYLAPVANNWMKVLNINKQFPGSLTGLIEECHAHDQTLPTPLILRYEKGGYNTLHQDLYGQMFFPMQMVLFLDEPGKDYQGGEFVLIEQRPRAQSKAIVLKPAKGDMLIFTTNFRPVKGAKGYYRVNMKHGVSEVTAGKRYTLGVIFHDAL
ncbi:MAG: prolyl 4-hydroxylase subunit alpha [Mucilaginibacter sp.]|nr:prolyl 4-hydroxylase subunit alpha [Mucilaginibacter sp.]